MGDEGSGYDLGRRGLQLAARMADGRMPAEKRYLQEILQFYGVKTPHELIWAVKGEDSREKIAACTRVLAKLAAEGSSAAAGLLEHNAEELALLCRTAAQKAGGEELPVILSGGLTEVMLPQLRKRLEDVRRLAVQPCVACAALALQRAGLKETARRLLEGGASC